MIYIEWRGLGPIVIIILFVFGLLEFLIVNPIMKNDNYTQEHYWPLALAFCLSAITTWCLGRYLNNKPVPVRDKETDQIFFLKNYHHFMHIPLQYHAIPIILAGLLIFSAEFSNSNNSAKSKLSPTSPIDYISFNTDRLVLKTNNKIGKCWMNRHGEVLGLYLSNPDLGLPEVEASTTRIQEFYRRKAAEVNGAIIEADKLTINGIGALEVIIKVPQEDLAMSYTGYLIIPFRDTYYYFKMTCRESGTTGEREAVVMMKLKQDGKVIINDDGTVTGWYQDPYDPNYHSGVMRNMSEDEQYDKEFPRHPLTRLRSTFKQIRGSIKIDSASVHGNN